MYLQSIFIFIILSWHPAKGSLGDRSYTFRMCVKECKRGCNLDEYPGKLPLYLTIFWWDCTDECKYQCMHNVTADDVKYSKPIKQFYGKVSLDQQRYYSSTGHGLNPGVMSYVGEVKSFG